jgi:hypothetical protein
MQWAFWLTARMPGLFCVVPWWMFHNDLSEIPPTGTRVYRLPCHSKFCRANCSASVHTSFSVKVVRHVTDSLMWGAKSFFACASGDASSYIRYFRDRRPSGISIVILSTSGVLTSFRLIHPDSRISIPYFWPFCDIFTPSLATACHPNSRVRGWIEVWVMVCLLLFTISLFAVVAMGYCSADMNISEHTVI